VIADPNPTPVNTAILLTATVDDTTTGGSPIDSAEYAMDGISFVGMDATDGAFDEVREEVEAVTQAFRQLVCMWYV
jgi:hypothetical protein